MATNNAINVGTAATGKVLQGQGVGTAPSFSTATYPSTATGTGTILRADGTNWVATTATYPNTTTANAILYSTATNTVGQLTTSVNSLLSSNGSGVPTWSTTVSNDIRASYSNSGATATLEVNNQSNTANSDALLLATVAGSSGGDAYTRYIVTGAGVWAVGVDNSDSDAFVVSASTAPGSSNLIRGDSNGGQYKGYNTNTAPASGFIGEQLRGFGNAISLTNLTAANITSISVTPGIWNICCICNFAGSITGTQVTCSVSTTSATQSGLNGDTQASSPTMPTSNSNVTLVVPPFQILVSSTTTYYLVATGVFSAGTMTGSGRITATRIA